MRAQPSGAQHFDPWPDDRLRLAGRDALAATATYLLLVEVVKRRLPGRPSPRAVPARRAAPGDDTARHGRADERGGAGAG